MTARRPLLTAAAAGSVLFALWFVPSANAFVENRGTENSTLRADAAAAGDTSHSVQKDTAKRAVGGTGNSGRSATAESAAGGTPSSPQHLLADTGGPNTTPYVIGGAACLALGAGLVGYSVRRTRDETA